MLSLANKRYWLIPNEGLLRERVSQEAPAKSTDSGMKEGMLKFEIIYCQTIERWIVWRDNNYKAHYVMADSLELEMFMLDDYY